MYHLFDLATLVALLSVWLDSKQSLPLLQAVPGAAPFIPQLKKLFEKLGGLQLQESALSAQLKILFDQLSDLDRTHDRLLRGMNNLIAAVIILSEDATYKASLETIRNKCFPKGGMGVLQSYLDEAGYVEMAEMKMTDDDKSILGGIVYNGRAVLEDYSDWIDAGKAIGTLETQKARLLDTDESDTTALDIRKSRFEAMEMITLVSQIIKLTDTVDDETRRILLQPLNMAEEKAVEKLSRRKSGEPSDDDAGADDAAVSDDAVVTVSDESDV